MNTFFPLAAVVAALMATGCEPAGSDPLPFPKGYVPKNPPIEKPAPAPARHPVPDSWSVGDRVKVSVGYDTVYSNEAHGVITELRGFGEVEVLFIDKQGCVTKIKLPVSILSRP